MTENQALNEIKDIFGIFNYFDVDKLKRNVGLGRAAEIENIIVGFLEEHEKDLIDYITGNYDHAIEDVDYEEDFWGDYDEDACMLED